jgi:hypothetical protein
MGAGTAAVALWRRGEDTHHGLGHVAPLNPRGSGGRVKGRHEDPRPDVAYADEAHKVRLSSMWVPQHRADDPTDVLS